MTIARTNMQQQIEKSGKKKQKIITHEKRGDITVIRIRYGA